MKYEYCSVWGLLAPIVETENKVKLREVTKRLSELGRKGWRVVHTESDEDGFYFLLEKAEDEKKGDQQ